jgi:predicted ATPase/DNA-binding CsgD family transcriptional regulator
MHHGTQHLRGHDLGDDLGVRSDPPPNISEREAEVLEALAEHLSNAQIANRLHISVRTVESHVSSLLRKVGVGDRRALAAVAGEARAKTAAMRGGSVIGVPPTLTSFVGRTADRDAVLAALEKSRVVSLLGSGGIGKTRLATTVTQAVAPSFRSGGAFVDLVPARAGFVSQAVASALGVIERGINNPSDVVVQRLRLGPSLLVLDNCEHVLEEVTELVERVLHECPEAKVLTTSRERLGVTGERAMFISPLRLGSEAEQLFVERAREVDPHGALEDSVVSEICARLDGMPLAIELAAARTASLGAGGVLAGLEDQMRFLSGSRSYALRHRSLRAVMEWSHELLDDEEQALFRHLSVFVRGFDLAAAAAISTDADTRALVDLIGRLADKSLLVPAGQENLLRWTLLEPIRAFAMEKLEASGEGDATRRLHLHWAARTASALEERITQEWESQFDEVADDLRAASQTFAHSSNVTAHGLTRSLAHLVFARGFYHEARGHYEAAAACTEDAATASEDMSAAAHVAIALSQGPDALSLLLRAAERAGSTENDDFRVRALAAAAVVPFRFHGGFGNNIELGLIRKILDEALQAADDDQTAATLLAIARAWVEGAGVGAPDPVLSQAAVDSARRLGDPILVLGALDALGSSVANAGRMREAHRIADERMELLDSLPRHEPSAAVETIDALQWGSAMAVCCGDLPAAIAASQRLLREHQDGDHAHVSTPNALIVLAMTGRFEEALDIATTVWRAWRRIGTPIEWLSPAMALAAMVHGLRGDGSFDTWRARSLEIAGINDPAESRFLMPYMAFVDARVAAHSGQLTDARSLVERAFASFPRIWYQGYARAAGAELAVIAELPNAVELLKAAAQEAAENDWAAACLSRAKGRLHEDRDALADAVDQWERIEARFERACTLLLLPDRVSEGEAELHDLGCPLPSDGHSSGKSPVRARGTRSGTSERTSKGR